MKMSINQGPHNGLAVSIEHCKQISNFLWDWYDSMPKEIASHIEVIVVNMTRSVSVKVVLSGKYSRYHFDSEMMELVCWKAQFDETLHYFLDGSPDKNQEELLTNKLRETLRSEIKTYQPILSELNIMLDTLTVHY